MSRHPHFLKSNKGNELPSQAVWLDTETHPIATGPLRIAHKLTFGWACYQRRLKGGKWSEPAWQRFSSASELWCWVESLLRPRTKLYLFAHNWAFDGPVTSMFRELPDRGFHVHRAIIDSPPVIITWRRDSNTIECLDTLNWWRMGLDQIGESIDLPKLPFPPPSASTAEWDTYCRRDVEVIRRIMHLWWEFLARENLGGFAVTLAGQALRSYRHRFMSEPILLDADEQALALARSAYHGARVECYQMGRSEGPIYLYDVNSMYPYVMVSQGYPTILRTRCRNPTPRELDNWLSEHAVVVRARLETDVPQYAHLLDDKLVFPVGRFHAYLTTPDVQAALKQGHLVDVDDLLLYETAPLFERFVADLYALRKQADKLLDSVNSWLLKILMNSLYGKFGQKGSVWEVLGPSETDEVKRWAEVDVVEGITYQMRQFAGVVQQRDDTPESPNSHPAIAAHVTAYARRYLWDLMELAGRGNVLYCDTDSLYVTQAGSDRLATCVTPTKLGALKLEGVSAWLDVCGPKDYQTPEKHRVKGVRKKAKWLNENTVEQEQWSSLVGLVASGDLSAPITKTVTKTLRREYTKGVVHSSGAVTPLTLKEW